ncbi:TIR domain-containing protein [Lysobacter sp. CFH 32150]|uniref:TIR domain-containing protein n=1 Tax=Lysobacter sp. CFH 32150 TaxID=2927128 RepID=UPI001FA740E8|nr:TIR domain-containing protein [Lysobacter sp. CFH 32150]MCI4566712.1 TIR domain-containing protein [Lysobacter sp. CFH 32150]
MADVFVSYCRRDKARVAPLVAAIESQGWSVWWDTEIAPGQEFDRLIDAELASAGAVLVVWTKDSVESRWVRGEAREAADRDILVPVRFDGATLPIDVRAFQTIDFDEASAHARGPQVQDMLHALDTLIARQRTPSSDAAAKPKLPSASTTGPARVEICVLPFANMSGDPQQDYFSDGITEDIITELSRWRLLAVRSRSASFRYRGVAVDMQQVARDLHVHFIVEGSVRRMGDRIRITAQLIDTETGNHIWAEKFDSDVAEIFTVQDEVVRTIVSTLVGRVQACDVERARRKPPASLAAYECVLRGNALPWDDPEGAAEAARLFEKAIEIDPDYGFAYALLAAMRYGQWYHESSDSDAALQEAYTLAKRAVELDENESTCFSILAYVCLLRRSFDLTQQYIRRAVELNPTNQWNMADMGLMLIYLGQAEEALTWFKRAREIDPYFEEPWYWRAYGQAYMVLHRYEEALAKFDRCPTRVYRIAALRAGCHARLGNIELARRDAAECMALKPDFSIRHWMAREPFKNPADAAHLADALRLAGLPE